MEQLKKCRTCGIEKSVLDFSKDKTKKYGVGGECKPCATKTSHKYYLKNVDSIKTKVSIYRQSYVPKHTREIDSRLRNLHTKAKNRYKKEFNISETDVFDLWGKQEGLCAYTKLPMLATSNQFNTVSLDRIDSSKGYIVGNIQLVCAAINKMKQEYPEELFIQLCHCVAQNNSIKDYPTELALIP